MSQAAITLSRAELDQHNRRVGGKKKVVKSSPLSQTLRTLTAGLTHTHHQLVVAAADFADSDEWARDGSPNAAHWLAAIADVETCTAREWIRVGRALRSIHVSADAFANGKLSYAKIRTLTRFATVDNEDELLELALNTTANHLPRALAAWLNRTSDPADLEAHQHAQRSLNSRTITDELELRCAPLHPSRSAGKERHFRRPPIRQNGDDHGSPRRDRLSDWADPTSGAGAMAKMREHLTRWT